MTVIRGMKKRTKAASIHLVQAIEVFTGTCLSFIFVATVESVVVEVLAHIPDKGRRSSSSPHNSSFALEVCRRLCECVCVCMCLGKKDCSALYF